MKVLKNRDRFIGFLTCLGVVGALLASYLLSTGASQASAPAFGTTRANAGFARAHALDHVALKAVVRDLDPKSGAVLAKHVYYGKAAQKVAKDSGTGGTPSSQG